MQHPQEAPFVFVYSFDPIKQNAREGLLLGALQFV